MRSRNRRSYTLSLRFIPVDDEFIEIFSDISGSPSSEECFNWPHLTGIPLKLGLCSL